MSRARKYGTRLRAQLMKKAVEIARHSGSLLSVADALEMPYTTLRHWYLDPRYIEWREVMDEAFEEGAERMYQQALETARQLTSPEGLEVEILEETYELPKGEYRMSRDIKPNEHGQYCTKRIVRKQVKHDPTVLLRTLSKHNREWRSDTGKAVEAGITSVMEALKTVSEELEAHEAPKKEDEDKQDVSRSGGVRAEDMDEVLS